MEELVAPTGELSSVEHLRVYSNMYIWRLVDILGEDYPTTAHALGERFYATAQDYLTRHPSTHPNLSFLGAGFPAYLRLAVGAAWCEFGTLERKALRARSGSTRARLKAFAFRRLPWLARVDNQNRASVSSCAMQAMRLTASMLWFSPSSRT